MARGLDRLVLFIHVILGHRPNIVSEVGQDRFGLDTL
jgi:hypothetical protein